VVTEPTGRWHAGMQCFVRQITPDTETHITRVDVDPINATDMGGCIAAVRRHDPAVRQIDVYADGEPDVRYIREGSGWTAWLIRWRVR
jgi:hypothetical protein